MPGARANRFTGRTSLVGVGVTLGAALLALALSLTAPARPSVVDSPPAPLQDNLRGARLFKALTRVGAEVKETDVTVWVEAEGAFSAAPRLRGLALAAARAFGLTQSQDLIREDDIGHSRSAVIGPFDTAGITYLVGAQSSARNAVTGRPAKTMVSVKARFSGSTGDRPELEDWLARTARSAVGPVRGETEAFVTITGVLPRGTRRSLAEGKARQFVRSLGGRGIKVVRGAGWGSLTAFAPSLGEPVRLGGRAVNLNVAWREDEAQGRFYLVAGTPLITEDY